ncbi:hypothetical protein [Chryseobacterium paridis]|uniref:Uncharacterized protein n=1 Tax=Chryseobacterium paridis TaxID=2800328 RepID=A0ABS1FXV1_9FLAO|nr:hypothetical protein [Chryseobacterium paridis]MBK1897276.1 hypothetical protein [Chryseobacterium paridis]
MSNQTPVTHRYYPRLSSVVTQDDIPDILGFLKPGITNLLDKIYYKDLQYSKGPKGDSAFYSLSVVSKRIDIEIPGTGISLVLNGTDDTAISAFPITVEYQWKILAYLRYFSLGNFSFEPQQIFEVALRVLNVTEEQAIAHFVNTFVTPSNQNLTPLMQFATDINAKHNLGLVVNEATTITKIVQDIYQNSNQKYASLVAFATYLLSDNLQDTAEKVKTFFKALMPQDIDEFIKEVAIPKFKATLMLSAAIEFPRSILKPVYPLNHPTTPLEVIPEDGNGDPKVSISFGEALFYADTEKGFGYNMDLVLNMSYPAQIGNTGFVIDIHNLKIDLSKTENIAEADADGRPKEFMGVYMEYTEIFLPKKWFKKKNPDLDTQQTIGISANHMLIGTGGLSGNISIKPTYAVKTVGNQTTVVDYFSKFFTLEYQNLKVKSMSSTTETDVHNMSELMTFMNGLDSPSQLKFVYPIALRTVAGDYREFQKEEDYYKFLSSLSIDSLEEKNRTLWFDLGKDPEKAWALGFSHFDIDFHQGQVVRSSLHAGLKIRKFKGYNGGDLIIDVIGEWESKENFKLAAAFLPLGLPMNLFNILTFNLQRIEIGKKNDNFYIEADTKISFPAGSFGEKLLGKEGIDLPAIRYYASGKFEIAGGSSIIPVNLHLNLGPVRMAVSAIHMGTIQRMYKDKMRTYNYIGFDGGININPLGLDVRGNGVKFYYTADNDEMVKEHGGTEEEYKDSYFHISTLEVDLVIPGSASASAAVAIIKGALTIPEPGVSTEYRGKVSLQLPKMNISGSAEMAFDPKYPGFLVDASVELPFVIPLGSFGIFGFRGLIGYRYVAHKKAIGMTEDDTWYDYYVHPQRGINTDKFIGPQYTKEYSAPFSFGAGASLATLDGRLASLRAMVLLSVPSMFAIDAGLTIISERLGLTEDDPKVPPFYAFVIVGDNSLEIGAGGNFQLNKNNGSFIDIKAEVQMGFFFKNQRPWYVNFGTRDKPIRASLFKDSVNIKAESYLMIAAKGIEAGARVDFNLNLIIVKVYAAIEVGAHISFERPQVGGYIYVEGGAEINLFIVSVALFISIYFRVELILPFLILAEFKFELKIKLAIFKIKLKVHLSIKWEKNDKVDTSAVPPLTYESDPPEIDYPKEERLNNAVKGVNMLTNETFDLPVVQIDKIPLVSIKDDPKLPIVPLDTYIDIKIEKGLIPTPIAGEKIGGHTSGATEFTDLIPPQKTQPGGHVLRQVKHQYSIEDVEIKILNKEETAWNKYNPYRAVLTEDEANSIANIDKFKLGFWQKINGKYDTIRILASTPFSFLDSAQPGWFIPEQYGITPSSLFCTQSEDVWHESNVQDKTVGTVYYSPTGAPYNLINGAYYNLLGTVSDATDYLMVSNASNPHNYPKSLKMTNGNTMVVLLPEASARLKLLLSTMASSVTIRYYKDVFSNAIYQNYALIDEVTKTKAELGTELIYEAADYGGQYVSKIEIIPYNANQQDIDDINAQIDLIWANATANATGEVTSVILSPTEQAEYDALVSKLKDLKTGGCTTSQCNELDFNVMHVENGYNGMFGNGLVNFDMSNVANKWIDYETQYMMITGGNTPPYVDFNTHSVIFLFLPNTPTADFIKYNSVITKITDKANGIDICYSNEYPKEKINKAVIIKVNKTTEKPLNLKFTPNCGCESETEPCIKDTKLCDFLSLLMYNLNKCIVYMGVDEVTQLRYSMKCFFAFIDTIYAFDKENPDYCLIEKDPGYVRDLLEKLNKYLTAEGSTISGALQLTKEISDIIFNLGNCGCTDDNNGNTVTNCYTLFHRVKWMTVTDYEYQQTIPGQPAVQADMQLMQEAMSKVVQPVWRPNSVYYINLKLKDNVNGDTPHIIDYYFAFKTAGPIGHFEKKNEDYIKNLEDANGNPIPNKKRNADEYPITSLKSYIDMKKSYPNADGDLLMSKPLFYGNEQCKIEFFFTKPYIYNMLKEWPAHPVMGVKEIKGSINILIKDPITKTIIPYPLPIDWQTSETVPGATPSWTSDTDPNLPLGIQQMVNYVNHVNHGNTGMACSITLGDAVKPKAFTYSVKLTDLQPEKLYTAMVFNAFDDDGDNAFEPQITPVPGKPDKVYEENQKIHEFVFKTSRYKDFKEQVESYKLKDYDDKGTVIGQKDAIYEVIADLKQQQLDDLYTLVSGGVENPYLKGLANTYSELFDRAFEGVMGLKPLNPPTNTEFVKIVNANNDVVALLIRNPEPFNDPKIPLNEMVECFKVLNAAGNANDDFKVIYAKDYSQILVMHTSKKIKDSKLKFRFKYKSWSGNQYDVKSEVTINELQINN